MGRGRKRFEHGVPCGPIMSSATMSLLFAASLSLAACAGANRPSAQPTKPADAFADEIRAKRNDPPAAIESALAAIHHAKIEAIVEPRLRQLEDALSP